MRYRSSLFCRHDLGSELVSGVTRSLKVLVILVRACQWMEREPSVSRGAEKSKFYLVGICLVNGLRRFRCVCRNFWIDFECCHSGIRHKISKTKFLVLGEERGLA